MDKKITFNEEDLKKNFTSPCGCSIFTAMKRAEIPVFTVGPENWTFQRKDGRMGRCIQFSPELREASSILAIASNSEDKKALARRDSLAGRSYNISY